jgi:hypothetical protein
VHSRNGFIESTKGIVLDIVDADKVRLYAINGYRGLYGKLIEVNKYIPKLRKTTVFSRTLTQVPEDLARQDTNFIDLMNLLKQNG